MKIGLFFIVFLLVSKIVSAQNDEQEFKLILPVAQLDNWPNGYEKSPIFTVGLGGEYLLKNNFGFRGIVSIKRGRYQLGGFVVYYGDFIENNLSFGPEYKINLAKRFKLNFGISYFAQSNTIVNGEAIPDHPGGPYFWDSNNSYIGLKAWLELELSISNRISCFLNTELQYGKLKSVERFFSLENIYLKESFIAKIPILELVGLKIAF